jgi:hypothetical protein
VSELEYLGGKHALAVVMTIPPFPNMRRRLAPEPAVSADEMSPT